MKYLSLDIETTGLDKDVHDILSIGMIVVDTEKVGKDVKLEDLPTLHIAIQPVGGVTGDLYALNMNKDLIEGLVEGHVEGAEIVEPHEVEMRVLDFIAEEIGGYEKITVIGKNAAGFDIPFIKSHYPEISGWFSHKVLDVGSMYFDANLHKDVPSLKKCKEIAGIDGIVTHNALEDAFDVVLLERYHSCK